MRADRLISILLLLQNKGKLTTKELSEKLEVTARTIHRDMEALSAAGIPVVAERGKTGGWRLMEQYRTKLTGLKPNEIKSLLIAPSFDLLDDLELSKDWLEARQKILASIPSTFQINANDIWNRIHVDTTAWRQTNEKVEPFKILQQAIWDEKKLHLTYERADGEMIERVVNPLGLVAKGSSWYLIASSNEKIRNYRASRIKYAVLTEEVFSRPNDFDLAKYWIHSTQEFISSLPKFEVHVEASPSILPRIRFTRHFIQHIKLDTPTENGWVPVNLCFHTEQEATEYILGFGDQINIISPTSLRKKIYNQAKAVLHFYEHRDED